MRLNVLYVDWSCFGGIDVVEAFRKLGHEVMSVELTAKSRTDSIDWDFVEQLEKMIEKKNIDMVFSFNYFATLSEACHKTGRTYMSWVYDSPNVKLYFCNIINECNVVYVFDRSLVEELNAKGIHTVHYAPLAVNVNRISSLWGNKADEEKYRCEIAFVGALYNEKNLFYDRLKEQANNPYLIGYLDGIIEGQMKVYGYNFLKDCLTPEIVKGIYDAMPYEVEAGSLVEKEYVYADYFLARRLAYLERCKSLERLSQKHEVFLYTKDENAQIGKVHNKGKVDYYDEMPLAFRYAKVNLNMTLRSIKTGIPLRAMDILGTGGFLLSNYQEDFLLHFEPDKDFVYYGSMEELEEKAQWYLKHDTERQKIAANGWQRVSENHTYEKSLERMLKYSQIKM